MRRVVAGLSLIFVGIGGIGAAKAGPPPGKLDLDFATYFGGNSFDAVRDVCVDHDGNLVVVGGTSSTDFPATAGTYSQTLQTGGASLGRLGACDAFVAKFTPAGQLIWATYLGGPNYDRAYAVEVDAQNRIFVCGRGGEGFPTTAGSFQPNFIDTFQTTKLPSTDEYGKQNGFLACISPTGQRVWASYVWYGSLCRDLDVDSNGDVVVTSGWNGNSTPPPAFLSGYRKSPTLVGGADLYKTVGDACVIKIKGDGTAILWGSWFCGTAVNGNRDETLEASVRFDSSGNVYFVNLTKSSNMPFNPADSGIHSLRGASTSYDYYLAKLSANGQNLIYGTYLGGSGNENFDTHQLAVDDNGYAYVAMLTPSTDLPTTAGVLQPATGGGSDVGVCKIGLNGAILQCTYLGGTNGEIVEGISVDAGGNVYLTGATRSSDFPIAGNAYQPSYGAAGAFNATYTADWNGFVAVMAADFKSLSYSTFMGKQCIINGQNAIGGFHSNVLAPDGSLILIGAWVTPNFPTRNAVQSTFIGAPFPTTTGATYTKYSDGVIARFNLPIPLYPEWVTANQLSGTDALELSSPAGDGVPNLVKYALGLNPKASSTTSTDGVAPGLPLIEIAPNNLSLTYQKNLAKTDVLYTVEASDNLTTWRTNGITETPGAVQGTVQTFKATVATGSGNPKFIRLKVTK